MKTRRWEGVSEYETTSSLSFPRSPDAAGDAEAEGAAEGAPAGGIGTMTPGWRSERERGAAVASAVGCGLGRSGAIPRGSVGAARLAVTRLFGGVGGAGAFGIAGAAGERTTGAGGG